MLRGCFWFDIPQLDAIVAVAKAVFSDAQVASAIIESNYGKGRYIRHTHTHSPEKGTAPSVFFPSAPPVLCSHLVENLSERHC